MTRYTDGMYLFCNDLNYIHGVLSGNFVYTGMTISLKSSDLVLTVSTGTAVIDNEFHTFTSAVSFTWSSASGARKSVIYISSAGDLTYSDGSQSQVFPATVGLTGKELKTPAPPEIPTGSIPIAEIYMAPSITEGTSFDVYEYDTFPAFRVWDSGSVTMSSGSQSATATHNLNKIPTFVTLMGDHSESAAWYITDKTTNTFVVNFPETTTDLRTLSWKAEL